jgi:hypothetical protein
MRGRTLPIYFLAFALTFIPYATNCSHAEQKKLNWYIQKTGNQLKKSQSINKSLDYFKGIDQKAKRQIEIRKNFSNKQRMNEAIQSGNALDSIIPIPGVGKVPTEFEKWRRKNKKR